MSMSDVIKSIEHEMFNAATEKDTKCENCKYHDDFTWACFNGSSDSKGEFTDNDFACEHHERRSEDGEEM